MRVTTGIAIALLACRFDPSYRDVIVDAGPPCKMDEVQCRSDTLSKCDGTTWVTIDDCPAKGQVCASSLKACAPCSPGSGRCEGQTTFICNNDGQSWTSGETCKPETGFACRSGICRNLCEDANTQRSNVGCEYWAVDLDNASISVVNNAAGQQFAVVVSNAEPDVATKVTVEQDDADIGQPAKIKLLATSIIAPLNLEVFKLGPREVDGSPDGEFNTGTGTALTRHAYRIKSSMPIVAYQFNPLENANVFSNDASQLIPTSALGRGKTAYVVAGWPQTIAISDVASENFGEDLRAFLAIVGTMPNTHVHIETKAKIIPGGPLPTGVPQNGTADVILEPFEVLNLETGGFNADFTGSIIETDSPVAVFPGSEASDAPQFDVLADRFCCADHVEDQLVPVRTAGVSYVLGRMPNRSKAVVAAGGNIGTVDEPELYRIVAVAPGKTTITTSLPKPLDNFTLNGIGAFTTITAHQDFVLKATQPIIVEDIQVSQDAAGIPRNLPGGDPSILFTPPVEQWRADYTLLTPDKYAFDFLVITAPPTAHVWMDGLALDKGLCEIAPADGLTDIERKSPTPPYVVYRCQLSYPKIDPTKPSPENVLPGKQTDGVHRIQADKPCGVIVYGFDSYVSYAYTGGTDLREVYIP